MAKRDIKAKRWDRRKLKRFLNCALPNGSMLRVGGTTYIKSTLTRPH